MIVCLGSGFEPFTTQSFGWATHRPGDDWDDMDTFHASMEIAVNSAKMIARGQPFLTKNLVNAAVASVHIPTWLTHPYDVKMYRKTYERTLLARLRPLS